jgi:NAD(P)-dependent dehydrogenase (short-subunit alcohol dehydrogenase family)
MKENGGGSIINNSSIAGIMGGGGVTVYRCAKAAVAHISKSIACDLGPFNIRVNAIAPGLIFTDTIRAELDEETVSRVTAQQILPREGAEADIVDAMVFLCSEAASFITGETLRVSGGFALSV